MKKSMKILFFAIFFIGIIFIIWNIISKSSVEALSKYGSRGNEVTQIQTKLKRWGYYNGAIDGIYGNKTVEAVKYFQRKNGLTEDEIAGSKTLSAMGINGYFSEYYGESIIKPNELAYRQAQGIYQPSECVIVGDDKRLDIDIPKSLGFKTVYVNKKGDIKRVEELSPKLIKKL